MRDRERQGDGMVQRVRVGSETVDRGSSYRSGVGQSWRATLGGRKGWEGVVMVGSKTSDSSFSLWCCYVLLGGYLRYIVDMGVEDGRFEPECGTGSPGIKVSPRSLTTRAAKSCSLVLRSVVRIWRADSGMGPRSTTF